MDYTTWLEMFWNSAGIGKKVILQNHRPIIPEVPPVPAECFVVVIFFQEQVLTLRIEEVIIQFLDLIHTASVLFAPELVTLGCQTLMSSRVACCCKILAKRGARPIQ